MDQGVQLLVRRHDYTFTVDPRVQGAHSRQENVERAGRVQRNPLRKSLGLRQDDDIEAAPEAFQRRDVREQQLCYGVAVSGALEILEISSRQLRIVLE